MSEISPVANRYIGLMSDLDEVVSDVFASDEVDIIDHYFGPDHTPNFPQQHSLHGFKRELTRLHDEITDGEPDADFMRRNIESTDFVIDALTGRIIIGENIEYLDFVEKVMGIRPQPTPEKELDRQKQEVAAVVEELGYRYNARYRGRFNRQHAIQPQDMQRTVEGLVVVTKEDLAVAVGSQALEGLEEPTVEVKAEKHTARGYFGTDENKKFIIKLNSNPKIQTSSLEERLVLAHERGHAFSSGTKKKMIQAGEMSPARGFLVTMSPAYSTEEIIARVVERYTLLCQTGLFADLIAKKMPFTDNVSVNMAIMANTGSSEQDVVEFGQEYLPYEKPGKIKKDVEIYMNNLMFRTIFAIDGEVNRRGAQIAAMSDSERQAELLRLATAA